VNPVNSTTAPSNASSAAAAPSQPTPPVVATSLLPDPAPAALAGADPLSMLYLFESKDQSLGIDEATKRISALQTERHQALAQEKQAIQQAAEAANNHSFWDDLGSVFGEVAKVAAVVVSVAAAVVSFGAATPLAAIAIAGAVLSTASIADGEFHVLHSLGVDDKTAGLIDTGMALGGAALTFGAGVGTAAATGGKAVSSLASTAARASAVVSGAAAIGRSASEMEAGLAQADSDRAAADEVAAVARSAQVQRFIQMIIDQTQSADQQSQHITHTIANTKTIQNETALTAATAVRG
jgi:hypothetical protein